MHTLKLALHIMWLRWRGTRLFFEVARMLIVCFALISTSNVFFTAYLLMLLAWEHQQRLQSANGNDYAFVWPDYKKALILQASLEGLLLSLVGGVAEAVHHQVNIVYTISAAFACYSLSLWGSYASAAFWAAVSVLVFIAAMVAGGEQLSQWATSHSYLQTLLFLSLAALALARLAHRFLNQPLRLQVQAVGQWFSQYLGPASKTRDNTNANLFLQSTAPVYLNKILQGDGKLCRHLNTAIALYDHEALDSPQIAALIAALAALLAVGAYWLQFDIIYVYLILLLPMLVIMAMNLNELQMYRFTMATLWLRYDGKDRAAFMNTLALTHICRLLLFAGLCAGLLVVGLFLVESEMWHFLFLGVLVGWVFNILVCFSVPLIPPGFVAFAKTGILVVQVFGFVILMLIALIKPGLVMILAIPLALAAYAMVNLWRRSNLEVI